MPRQRRVPQQEGAEGKAQHSQRHTREALPQSLTKALQIRKRLLPAVRPLVGTVRLPGLRPCPRRSKAAQAMPCSCQRGSQRVVASAVLRHTVADLQHEARLPVGSHRRAGSSSPARPQIGIPFPAWFHSLLSVQRLEKYGCAAAAAAHPADCRKALAEFAPAGAKKMEIIFSGGRVRRRKYR